MKKNKITSLIKLYLSIHLNKTTCILFGIVFTLWMVVLWISANSSFSEEAYFSAPRQYHQAYFIQALWIMQILNGAFLAFLVGAEMNSIALFDPMFVASIKRSRIIVAKLLANGILLSVMVVLECFLMILLAVLFFPSYYASFEDLLWIPYNLLELIELLLLAELVTLLIHSYFIPILIFIGDLALLLGTQQEQARDALSLYIPILEVEGCHPKLSCNPFVFSTLCLFFLLCILLLFQKKDISN